MEHQTDSCTASTPGAAVASASAHSGSDRAIPIIAVILSIGSLVLSLVALATAGLLRDYVERTGRSWEREHAATEVRIEQAQRQWTNDLFSVRQQDQTEQQRTQQEFKEYKTQEWLKERRLMDHEAFQIINGKKLPGDDSFGPTGNLQRMTKVR